MSGNSMRVTAFLFIKNKKKKKYYKAGLQNTQKKNANKKLINVSSSII